MIYRINAGRRIISDKTAKAGNDNTIMLRQQFSNAIPDIHFKSGIRELRYENSRLKVTSRGEFLAHLREYRLQYFHIQSPGFESQNLH